MKFESQNKSHLVQS